MYTDNVRFMFPDVGDTIISVVTHDKLWWVIVCKADGCGIWSSGSGYNTAEAAMNGMSYAVSVKAWMHAKDHVIKLAK